MTNTDAARGDIYQRVTDQIVAMIEAGAGKFEMPWHRAAGVPINASSRKPYRGVNTVMLWAAAQAAGYPSDIWATFKQWKEMGANVRKGERATSIVFWKISDPKDKEEGDADDAAGQEQRRSRALARGYAVFNAAQVDGYTAPVIPLLPAAERLDHAEAFFAGLGADIRHGGPIACYVPSRDQIRMPAFEIFRSGVAYYGTLAHEATHWTGHETRCARDLRNRFGDEAYAAEELVAEIGAAFLAADLDLAPEPRPDHASYIASWLKALKNDKRAIFTAAGKAQAAVDWMHAHRGSAAEGQRGSSRKRLEAGNGRGGSPCAHRRVVWHRGRGKRPYPATGCGLFNTRLESLCPPNASKPVSPYSNGPREPLPQSWTWTSGRPADGVQPHPCRLAWQLGWTPLPVFTRAIRLRSNLSPRVQSQFIVKAESGLGWLEPSYLVLRNAVVL